MPESGAGLREAQRALRRGIELGMTHIDSAEMYGTGRVEELVGDAIAGIERERLFITTKVLPSNATYAGTLRAAERSLQRLRCDYLDLYLLHWPGSHPLEETMSALRALVEQGKTRFVGVSNFEAGEMLEAAAHLGDVPLACNQVLYHLDERGIEHEVVPAARRAGIAVVAYTPFGRGSFLRGRAPPPRSARCRGRKARRYAEASRAGVSHRRARALCDSQGGAARARRRERCCRCPRTRRRRSRGNRRRLSPRTARTAGHVMNQTTLAPQEIKALAVRTAFSHGAGAVRVTAARTDVVSRRRMAAAFERGDFTTWGYDATYARRATDPQTLLLRGAQRDLHRRAVCIAGNPGEQRRCADAFRTMRGRRIIIGACATLLRRVAGEIDAAAGEPVTAIACDTRPLAERALAAAAGLGWIGKHTNLISPSLGSFVFLGEVVTTLELPPDAPLRKSCGECRRCVDACPTQALRGDYTIDATRCISDLTQRTDGIPPAMRPLIGDWVWGCDLCQLVCPPTVAAGTPGSSQWSPASRGTARPALVELLALRSGEFKRQYREHGDGLARRCRAAPQRRRRAGQCPRPLGCWGPGEVARRRSASDGARSRRLGAGPNRLAQGAGRAAPQAVGSSRTAPCGRRSKRLWSPSAG